MGVKTEVVRLEDKTVVEPYPVLKTSKFTGAIVYFTSPLCGVLFAVGDDGGMDKIGYESSAWEECHFEKFNGKVIHSNE